MHIQKPRKQRTEAEFLTEEIKSEVLHLFHRLHDLVSEPPLDSEAYKRGMKLYKGLETHKDDFLKNSLDKTAQKKFLDHCKGDIKIFMAKLLGCVDNSSLTH